MGGALGSFGKTIGSNMAGKTGLFSPTGAIGGSGLGQFLHKINTNMSGETGLFAKDGALGGKGGGLLDLLKNMGGGDAGQQDAQSQQPQLYGQSPGTTGFSTDDLTSTLMQYLQQRRR